MMTVLMVMSFSGPLTLIPDSELRLLPTYSLGLALSGGAERGAGTPSSLLPIFYRSRTAVPELYRPLLLAHSVPQ